MQNLILKYIKGHPRQTISLAELEGAVPGDTFYQDFAAVINKMAANSQLLPVKRSGTNRKQPPLANAYRINRACLNQDLAREMAALALDLHPAIMLESYYKAGTDDFHRDWPLIELINAYLKNDGLPADAATASERSYQIAGDEKWIDEQGGRQLLERLGLLQAMRLYAVSEPLMLAVNPKAYSSEQALHLVVENKSAFNGLLPALDQSPFLSLIFGSGWKIVGNLHMLDRQLNWQGRNRCIYYFGDLDWEGLSIWHRLQREEEIPPAVPFYRALLEQDPAAGKERQRENPAALEAFATYFTAGEGIRMAELLEKRRYYPQEGLEAQHLQQIWRSHEWNLSTGR